MVKLRGQKRTKEKMKYRIGNKIAHLVLAFLVVVNVFIGVSPTGVFAQSYEGVFTAGVMAPLHIDDWEQFENDLSLAKDMGVNSVSVDVWWGDVEKNGDNQFNWSYYEIGRAHV